MEWADFPKTLLKTLSSFKLEMVRQFWTRFFTGEHIGKLKVVAHQILELVDFSDLLVDSMQTSVQEYLTEH